VQSELLKQLSSERDQMNRAVTAAFKANASKSRFLASVSHDLRQPMYAINLYISTLLRQVQDLTSTPEREERWQGVSDGLLDLEGSAQYLNAMFEALLDLSRLDSGSLEANIRYVSIKDLISHLEADYSAQASDLGLVFRARIPEKLGRLEVQTDPILLERILRNLLVNALRYTREGGVCLALVLRPGGVEFRVVDTGPGIEPDLCEQVFDEFYQVQNSESAQRRFYDRSPVTGKERSKVRSQDGGIGLGLSISARLAEKLGTKVKLRSRVGRGSIFSFKLPARPIMRLHENLPSDRRSNQNESKLDTKDLYIAVIDDDFEIRRSVEALLSTLLGAEVYTAEDGYQAAAFLGGYGRVPDLLISDYGLLAGDGIQAIEVVRDEFMKDIPAIIITGDTSVESFSRLRASGFKILYKPTTGPQLISAIEEVLMAARLEGI
jgi:signal transduction histidine kinase/CheY-like chemotaxis protein